MKLGEVLFEVRDVREGGYDVRAFGHSIFTRGEDWDELKAMARDAVLCHFDQGEAPRTIRLRVVGGDISAADPVDFTVKTNG